ncbi:MAG: DUF420 domain-containing protein [Anaerolineae bacterium]|nr:DUF420 domain-containing protein [Anaerolineae bacterium]
MDLRTQPGFLGTGASTLADLTLIVYIALLIPAMLIGFTYARRKKFDSHHKPIMTAITLFNWFLIGFLMFASYRQNVLPELGQNLSQPSYLLPTLHLVIGGLAQIVATYLVIRMWFESQLPAWFKVNNIKRYMRFTLAGWLIAALLGIGIYITWYAAGSTSDPAAPVTADSTPEVVPEEAPETLPEATPEVTVEPAG